MEKTLNSNHPIVSAQPRLHQHAPEIQAYGTVSHMLPLELEEPVRLEMTERLNHCLPIRSLFEIFTRSLTGR